MPHIYTVPTCPFLVLNDLVPLSLMFHPPYPPFPLLMFSVHPPFVVTPN